MNDPKDPSRRQAIRYLIGGTVAAAYPIPSSVWAAGPPAGVFDIR